mmetsp:Transcript_129021/g.346059  ORF Transcript_129021/g.346059 Transcript_129021/m.346059 type:complete len:144 (-) Transcript_129021:255-686(-)
MPEDAAADLLCGCRLLQDKPTVAPPNNDEPTAAPPSGGPPPGAGPCADTPGWANGDDSCIREGFGPEQGCSDRGWTCEAYARHTPQAWCVDGAVVPGMETALGEVHGFPEQNCCVCGGGEKAPPPAAQQLDARGDPAAQAQSS